MSAIVSDYHLRFADEAESLVVADMLGALVPAEGGGEALVRFTHRYATLVIGIHYATPAPVPEGEEPPPPVARAGWHVNLRLLGADAVLPPELAPFVIHPVTPSYAWAAEPAA